MSSVVTHLTPIYQHVSNCWPFDALFLAFDDFTSHGLNVWTIYGRLLIFSFVSVPILFSKGMRWHLGGTVKENSFNLVQACIVWFLDFWHVGVGGLSEFYSPLVFFSGFPCFQQLPHFTMIRIWMDGSGGLWENQAIWFEDRRVHCNLCILDPSIPSGFGSRGETKSTQWEYQNVYIFLTYFDNEDCPGLICNFALIFVIGLSLWHRGADVSTLERRNPSM